MTPPPPRCRLTLDGLLQPFTSQPLHQPFGPSRVALHSSVKRTVWKSVLTYLGPFKSLICFYNNSQLSYSLGSWEVPSSRGVHDGAYHICLGSIAAILAVLTCLAEVVLLQIVCFFPHPFQVSRLYYTYFTDYSVCQVPGGLPWQSCHGDLLLLPILSQSWDC